MNHAQFKDWLQLFVHDELGPDEQAALDRHLTGCKECRSELEQLRAFQSVIARSRQTIATDALLLEARQELRAALRIERTRVTWWNAALGKLDDLLTPAGRLAVSGASLAVVGFIAGALVFSSDSGASGVVLQSASDDTEVMRGEARITNVRFDDADPSDDEIEFSFEAVSPVRVKGSPNDPGVQSVLTRALMTEENPGVRLRTVSAITSQIQIHGDKAGSIDHDVKRALIGAMKYDANPGVRMEAMKALKRFPFDDEIKEGLLHVLGSDKSEGMRVEAINSLGTFRDQMRASDEHLLETLQKRMENDNNRYVRQRARAVLEEVKQQ